MDISGPVLLEASYLRRASSQPKFAVPLAFSCAVMSLTLVVSLTHKAINGPREASIPAVHSLITNNNHGGEISFGRRWNIIIRR